MERQAEEMKDAYNERIDVLRKDKRKEEELAKVMEEFNAKLAKSRKTREALESAEKNERNQVGRATEKVKTNIKNREKRNKMRWNMLLESEEELIESVEDEQKKAEKMAEKQIKKLKDVIKKGNGKGKR